MTAVDATAARRAQRQQIRAAQRAQFSESVALSGLTAFRLALAHSRDRGVPFSLAWKIAMRTTLPNGKLYGALLDTMPEWQAAYELRPPTPREEAVGRLAA